MLCKIFLFLLLLSSVTAQSQVQGKYYSIYKVTDGDTFVIQDGTSNKFKIRLTGIDAPESRNVGTRKQIQVFGDEAKTHLQNYLRNRKVRLLYDIQKKDRYGRTLAYVYLENGTFLNDYLLRKGYARMATFPPNVKFIEVFRKSEEKAQRKKLGLWKHY